MCDLSIYEMCFSMTHYINEQENPFAAPGFERERI